MMMSSLTIYNIVLTLSSKERFVARYEFHLYTQIIAYKYIQTHKVQTYTIHTTFSMAKHSQIEFWELFIFFFFSILV